MTDKRSNRLSETLNQTQAKNAALVIRNGSADSIMALEIFPKKDAEYMIAFVPFVQKYLDSTSGSIHV